MCFVLFIFVIMAEFKGDYICSLKDQDASDLFITQTPSKNESEGGVGSESHRVANKFLGQDPHDFGAPLVSLTGNVSHYSDISEEDVDFDDYPMK